MSLELKELLSPVATLLAVVFAIFAFTFPRSLTLYKERRASIYEIDVPSSVKKQFVFRFSVLGDSYLFFLTSLIMLILGSGFGALLLKITRAYSGSQPITGIEALGEFGMLLTWLGFAISFLIGASLLLFANEIYFSEKKSPVLVRFFIRSVLGQRTPMFEAESLLPEAHTLYKNEAYNESVLNSYAALEIELKNRLGLPPNVGFGRILGGVREELGDVILTNELLLLRRYRNIAAHPTPEGQISEKAAKKVLNLIEDIIRRLQLNKSG